MKTILSVSVLGVAALLAAAVHSDVSANNERHSLLTQNAALQAENADLKESLRVAQSAIHAAPLAVIAPGGGESAPVSAGQRESALTKPTSPAAYVAAHRPVQSCAGGVCMPAAQGPRYQYQSRSSQPRRFVGRLFGRR
jgi:Tfp pilus assembly protein PilV